MIFPMRQSTPRHWELIALVVLIAVSSFLHFWRIERPENPVFDEILFATFASDYASRPPLHDIHPPLGKLLFGAAARMSGVTDPVPLADVSLDRKGVAYAAFEDEYAWKDFPYVSLRRLSAAVGIALIPLVYLLAR